MYDHYIAIDWAQRNMAIARMTAKSAQVHCIDVASNLEELKVYLTSLRGKKILTFEETTTAQWLYIELKEYVDKVLVCDPYRNRLLSEGPKTDKIDATKLVNLLKAGLLKEVFHSGDEIIELRKLVSGYDDLIKSGVRLKNQRAALFRSKGKRQESDQLTSVSENFVLQGIEKALQINDEERERYEQEFKRLNKTNPMIRVIKSVPGIGTINAVKIAAVVVNPKRFPDKGKFLSYCGLVKHEKMSGGRSYGQRYARYSRTLKCAFKTAAISQTRHPDGETIIKDYYRNLINDKGYPEHNARHALARKIALITWAVMKSGQRYHWKKWSKQQTLKATNS